MITAHVLKPEGVKIEVTVDMTLAEWREVLKRTQQMGYYGPWDDLRSSVGDAIRQIEERAVIREGSTTKES